MAHPIHAITRPHKKLLTQYFLMALFTGPGFFFAILPLYFRYKTLNYRFDDEGVSMSWGYFWRREIHLTYARIQDIHLSRGLVERWLGLASVQVQTASGASGAEMTIVGLTQFESVRDYLYSKMRGAHAAGSDSPTDDEPLSLLTEIRDELRAIRSHLGAE